MKTCARCKEDKSTEVFSKNSRAKDGLHTWCKPCFSDYERERYKNGDKIRKKLNKQKIIDLRRDIVWKMFEQSCCVDCNEKDPVVLDFDHLDPETKLFNISDALSRDAISMQRFFDEIAKCEIVCANCHRRRTAKQFGSWRLVK